MWFLGDAANSRLFSHTASVKIQAQFLHLIDLNKQKHFGQDYRKIMVLAGSDIYIFLY